MSEELQDWDEALQGLVDGTAGVAPASPASPTSPGPAPAPEAAGPTPEALLAERTADLQRVQAEYANYKKRVDRDRALARQGGIEAVLADLMPVLDGIEAARAHDELTGGAKLLADELAKVTAKYGLEPFGAEGEAFDPHVHEALMSVDQPGYDVTSVAQVFQSGYRLKDRVLRPARVAVAEPSPAAAPAEPEPPEPPEPAAAAEAVAPEAAADAPRPRQPRPPRQRPRKPSDQSETL